MRIFRPCSSARSRSYISLSQLKWIEYSTPSMTYSTTSGIISFSASSTVIKFWRKVEDLNLCNPLGVGLSLANWHNTKLCQPSVSLTHPSACDVPGNPAHDLEYNSHHDDWYQLASLSSHSHLQA